METVIIYKQDNGVVAVISPASVKDVPTGKPYKIIDSADLPADRSQRNGWTVDEADLTDGVGA